MELPQSRPFNTKGSKPAHDFLSLCSHSNVHTDPKPTTPSSQGSLLKTHDFLQPLEYDGANEEISRIDTITTTYEKPPLQHVLPGGIGTYTISPIPYFHQRIPKPELSPPTMFTAAQASGGNERNIVEENSNSNCSSYAVGANGFTLWDEYASGKNRQIRKENSVGERTTIRDVATTGQRPVVERRSQSLTNNHLSGFNSLSSSQGSEVKSQSFMDMMRSAKGSSQDGDLNDDEDTIIKKETSSTIHSHRVDLRGSDNNQKLNTPRSKHSATEQRRRSKINDRFQMLRQLIPNCDQKRDKASFLLEVIEYIQFLVEKADKYETSYQGWNHEPAKLLNWRNNQQLVPEGTVAVTPKLEEEKNNILVSLHAPIQDIVIDHPTTATTSPFPLSVQSNNFASPVIEGNHFSQFHTRCASSETVEPSPSSRGQAQPVKEEEVLKGNISISSVYSQGLVTTLREALEDSGVDLTKTNISVEIKLAKQSSSSLKDHEFPRTGNDNVKQTRKPKRLKTGQS